MKEICTAVIVAAGSARRMQGIDKITASMGGIPLIRRTALALAESSDISYLVIVTREDLIPEIQRLCGDIEKLCAIVVGGADRAESVSHGLDAIPAETELVAIHDGARPLITPEVISAAVQGARDVGAAAPAVAVRDTVKVAQDGFVQQTPDRSSLFGVQTPQVLKTSVLRDALAYGRNAGIPLTDDCSAVEAYGQPVMLTEGSEENIKITTPLDLALGEIILERRKQNANRSRL